MHFSRQMSTFIRAGIPIIEALDTLRVDTKSKRFQTVLEDVSLELRPGEILSVIGPNGAGKSTLLRVLAGTLEPSAGEVRLFGRSLHAQSRREIARRLSVVPQESEVAFGFSVKQVVMMGRAPHQTGLLLASGARCASVRSRSCRAANAGAS